MSKTKQRNLRYAPLLWFHLNFNNKFIKSVIHNCKMFIQVRCYFMWCFPYQLLQLLSKARVCCNSWEFYFIFLHLQNKPFCNLWTPPKLSIKIILWWLKYKQAGNQHKKVDINSNLRLRDTADGEADQTSEN